LWNFDIKSKSHSKFSFIRPSSDAVDGLDSQVKNLETQLVSLKQSHQEELKNMHEEVRTQKEGFDKEKNEYGLYSLKSII